MEGAIQRPLPDVVVVKPRDHPRRKAQRPSEERLVSILLVEQLVYLAAATSLVYVSPGSDLN